MTEKKKKTWKKHHPPSKNDCRTICTYRTPRIHLRARGTRKRKLYIILLYWGEEAMDNSHFFLYPASSRFDISRIFSKFDDTDVIVGGYTVVGEKCAEHGAQYAALWSSHVCDDCFMYLMSDVLDVGSFHPPIRLPVYLLGVERYIYSYRTITVQTLCSMHEALQRIYTIHP